MSLVLYSDANWASPYVLSAFVALTEKKLPFEVRNLNLGRDEHKTPEFADASITVRVPMLVHDGFWLTESAAIVEYLDDVFPEPNLLPRATKERARARQIMGWMRSDFQPLRTERSTHTFYWKRPLAPLSEQAQASAQKLVAGAMQLLKAAHTPTQLFSTWSVADLELALMLMRLVHNGDATPRELQTFAHAQWQRPSVRAYLDHPRTEAPI